MIRNLTLDDLVCLEDKAQFPVQNLIHKPMVLERSFEDEKGLIGSLLINRTLEVSIIFNDRSARDRVKILKQLPGIIERELLPQGYRDAHVFIPDNLSGYADILVRHLKFERVVGQALVRRY